MTQTRDLQAVWFDLKAHVERLANERQQYLEVFEASPEAYVLTDANGHIIDANGAAVDVLQRRKRHLRGKPLVVLVAAERRPGFRSRMRALSARLPGAERSWRTVVASGEQRVELKVTARAIERQGTVTGFSWLLQPAG